MSRVNASAQAPLLCTRPLINVFYAISNFALTANRKAYVCLAKMTTLFWKKTMSAIDVMCPLARSAQPPTPV